MPKGLVFRCTECDYYCRDKTTTLRNHFEKCHPEVHRHDIEYHIVTTNNPQLDVDLLLVRYLDHQETIHGLNKQGIFVKHFLQSVGVARSNKDDMALMGRMKKALRTPEQNFDKELRRRITWLKKSGAASEELEAAITALKLIDFTKKMLARTPEKPKEPEERLIGRFTVLEPALSDDPTS
jgi:hypothetical protein